MPPGVKASGALWPAGGFLLGVLLLSERRRWPWLLPSATAAGLAAQLAVGRATPVAVGLTAANCAESLLAALGWRRLASGRLRLDALHSVLVFALAGVTAAGVTALLGAGVLALGMGSPYWITWVLLWLADSVGILVITPVVLVTVDVARGDVRPSLLRVVEEALVLAGLAAVAFGIFTRPVGGSRLLLDFVFPVFPFLLWASLRFRSRGDPFATLVLWAIAGAGTVSNLGRYTSPAYGSTVRMLQMETFLALASFGVLVGAGRADELRQRERSLARSNARLRREGELLRKAEERFRGLLEAAPGAIVIIDEAGAMQLVNAQAEQLFGYPREELIGETLELLVPERSRAGHVHLRSTFFANPTTRPMGRGLELRIVRKDGSELPVEITLGALETNAGVLVSAAVRDIRERKRLVEELEQRGRLMDLVHDAIIVREPTEGRTSYWNREAEEIYGYSAAAACGRIVHELLRTEFPESVEAIKRRLLTRGRWEGELWHIRGDGRRILVSTRQALQRGEQGEPIAVIELHSDITEQRRMEEAQSRLAAMVEHSDDAILGKTGRPLGATRGKSPPRP